MGVVLSSPIKQYSTGKPNVYHPRAFLWLMLKSAVFSFLSFLCELSYVLELHTHLAVVSNFGAKLEYHCSSQVGCNTFLMGYWCASIQHWLRSKTCSAACASLLATQQLIFDSQWCHCWDALWLDAVLSVICIIASFGTDVQLCSCRLWQCWNESFSVCIWLLYFATIICARLDALFRFVCIPLWRSLFCLLNLSLAP